MTPPTLTGYEGTITDQPTITWTPDALFEAATTRIKAGNDEVLKYTVSSGQVVIDRDTFRMADTYTITIIADGYDNATTTVTLSLGNWTEYILFDTDDIIAEEPVYLQDDDSTTLADYHDRVLYDLGTDLENKFTRDNEFLKDYEGSNYSILDYILNPRQLKRVAVYYALYQIFDDRSTSEGDPYARKRDEYAQKYNKYLSLFPKHIEFSDLDRDENELPPYYRDALYPRNLFPREDTGKWRFTR